MKLTDKSNHPDFWDLYDVQVTPTEARRLVLILSRINPKELLAGDVIELNNLVNQLERISNES